MKEDAKTLIQFMEQLEGRRMNWSTVWQEINDYMLPFKQDIYFTDVPGQQRTGTIFDSTATHAILRLAASLGSLLTNPAAKWLGLETDVDELNIKDETQEYFDAVVKIIMRALENSNFYTEANRMYIDLVAYGTGILYVEPSTDPLRDLRFSARGVNETYISENNEGIVDVVFRKFNMTVRQLIEEFGEDNVSSDTKKKAEKSSEEFVEVIHAVFPRTTRSRNKKDGKNKKFASVWLERTNNHELRKGGYDTFPYIVAEWLKETGEIYGRSPAMTALPDVKTLNLMVETLLMTGQKIANPILMVPDEAFADLTGEAGQIIAYDPTTKGRIEPVIIGANLPFTFEMVSEKRTAVKEFFYSDQMVIPTGNRERVTAEEIRAKQSESARILGPTFGTLNYEFLSPLIDRVYDILLGVMLPNGAPLFPPEPEYLSNQNAKLKFLSPLAKAQRSHELQSIQYTVGIALEWANIDPSVLDNIDFDTSIRTISDISGSPGTTLKSVEQVAAIREQRAQQQAAQQEMEMKQMQMSALKDGMSGVKNLKDSMGEQNGQ